MSNGTDGAVHDDAPVLLGRSEFAVALRTANDVVSLKNLYDRVGAIEELAKKMRLALSEENRIAEGRIQVARKLGELLRRSVRRGGVGSNSHGESSIRRGGSSAPLPEGIDRNMSSRLQALASVPEEVVIRYCALQRERNRLITMADLLRIAKKGTGPKPSSPADDEDELQVSVGWTGLLDAVSRVASIEMCVGLAPPRQWRDARPAQPTDDLRGVVFVVVSAGEERMWLTQLRDARSRRRVSEAFALLRAATTEDWFKCLERDWTVTFLRRAQARGDGQVLAYHGDKRHACALCFQSLGATFG